MKIFSIDPSLRNTCVLAWEDGEIYLTRLITTTKPKQTFLTVAEKDAARVEKLITELTALILQEKPDLVVVEQSLGGTRSSAATKALALVAGALTTLATLEFGATVWQFVRIRDVKVALTGSANATKTQMIEAAASKYPILKKAMTSERTGKWATDAEHYADAAGVYEAFQAVNPFKHLQGK